MFARIKYWFEEVDPYYTQRLIIIKYTYGMLLFTLANWIFKPVIFGSYFALGLSLSGIYDAQIFDTFKKKYNAIIVSFLSCMILSVTLYFMYPHRVFFILTVISIFVTMYVVTHFKIPSYSPFIISVFNTYLLINNSLSMEGSLQIAINICSTVWLTLLLTIFIHKTFPNYYHIVMRRALVQYLNNLIKKINSIIENNNLELYQQALEQLYTIERFKNLVKIKYKPYYFRIFIYLRNIFMVMASFDVNKLNHVELIKLRDTLNLLKLSLQNEQEFEYIQIITKDSTFDFNFIDSNIRRVAYSWNYICKK